MHYNKEALLSLLEGFPFKDGDSFHEGYNDVIVNFIGTRFNDFSYDYGASKFVIIPKNTDYVIKIPYNCGYYYYSGSSSYGETEDYVDFINAEGTENGWDYCNVEVERFSLAKKEKLDKCLAETKLLGYVNDYPIYVQEKCITLLDLKNKGVINPFNSKAKSKEEKSRTLQVSGSINYHLDLEWLTSFRLYYGEHTLITFLNFLKKEKWDDLSSYNIGYLLSDNRPVLIDYSSYNE